MKSAGFSAGAQWLWQRLQGDVPGTARPSERGSGRQQRKVRGEEDGARQSGQKAQPSAHLAYQVAIKL